MKAKTIAKLIVFDRPTEANSSGWIEKTLEVSDETTIADLLAWEYDIMLKYRLKDGDMTITRCEGCNP